MSFASHVCARVLVARLLSKSEISCNLGRSFTVNFLCPRTLHFAFLFSCRAIMDDMVDKCQLKTGNEVKITASNGITFMAQASPLAGFRPPVASLPCVQLPVPQRKFQ